MEINAPEVRLVGKEGEPLGIVPISQALKMAEERIEATWKLLGELVAARNHYARRAAF